MGFMPFLRLLPVIGLDEGVYLGIRGPQLLRITMPGGQHLLIAMDRAFDRIVR